MKAIAFLTAALMLGFFASAKTASAQHVSGEMFVVLASESPGAMDPSLSGEPALQQPPFNMFRSMRVLERSPMSLHTSQSYSHALPNGRTIRVELLGQLPNGRYRVRVSINRPGQSDYLQLLTVVAAPGDPFFVVGQSYQGGKLVIGLRVGARSPHAVSGTGPRPPPPAPS